jgi:hypothetical protein
VFRFILLTFTVRAFAAGTFESIKLVPCVPQCGSCWVGWHEVIRFP